MTAILLGIFVFFLLRYKEQLYTVRDISFGQFSLLFVLVLCSVTLNGSKLNQLTRFFSLNLTTREWFGLSSITTTLNSIFFKAGSLATSNYLKRKHDFPYMSFLGSLGADQLILFFMCGTAGGAISFYLMTGTTVEGFQPIAFAYLFIVLTLFLAAKFAPRLQKQNHKILDALVRAIHALHRILKNRKLFSTLCAHNIALIVLTSLRFFVVCKVLQLQVPLVYCFLFTTVMIFVSAVPLFQSDIGSREMAVGLLSELAGTGFNEGLLATLIDRIFVFLLTLLFTIFFKNLLAPSQPPIEKA
ncbi:MAG: lysylphosphatidylglycerol synthase domain-containing protein [Nitrospinae bacterium]|jgi:uncharacterized membrane protein YbhN (UPF0104 family)|nr:lysylphosphatidylglycerol synthase domain-containing protein [Nitrospinota bacterium]MDA1109265.1 lysylphosphatidylglycerol synthase domain-containing protein [Nitrospinota bacterium]